MPSPPIQLFLTSITNIQVKGRQDLILRVLNGGKIPFTAFDLADHEEAKNFWRRKAPAGKQTLPGILVGGRYPGDFDAFEMAVENDELDTFLRLKETWNLATDEDEPALEVKPVGIYGAMPVPTVQTRAAAPKQPKPVPIQRGASEPLKSAHRSRPGEIDVGSELQDVGLQGVMATDEELKKLVEELGLDGDDAADMVKNLGGATSSSKLGESENGDSPSKADDTVDAKGDAGKNVP